MTLEPDSSNEELLSSIARPIVLLEPELINSWPWLGHIPFAFWVVEALAPRSFVELGTHTGTSYCAFCQAVSYLALPTACWAVDTWKGDPQAGFYGEDVIETLRGYHDPKYGAFSRLVRSTFDDARSNFSDGTIDLLHIDGCHTYDAVLHDFENWLPKLSSRAVVLFHDINVRENEFGVWRFWEEVSSRYPSFSFLHSHGLGVLAVGPDQTDRVRRLTALSKSDVKRATQVRTFFQRLGDRLEARMDRSSLLQENEHLKREIIELQAQTLDVSDQPAEAVAGNVPPAEPSEQDSEATADSGASGLDESSIMADDLLGISSGMAELVAEIAALKGTLARRDGELDELRAASRSERLQLETRLERSRREVVMLAEDLIQRHEGDPITSPRAELELASVLSSRSWRITAPLRVGATLLRAAKKRDWDALSGWRETLHQFQPPRLSLNSGSASALINRPGQSREVRKPVIRRGQRHTPKQGRPLIAFVSGFPGTPSETYRVFHPISVLKEFFEIFATTEADLPKHHAEIESAAILVLFRVGMNEYLFAVIEQAQANGCLVIYDADDLIFDPAIGSPRFIDGLRHFPAEDHASFRGTMDRARRIVGAVDACTMSTPYLAGKVEELGKTAFVLPNGMNVTMLNWYDNARAAPRGQSDGKLRIGYASGTRTHERDFAVAKGALLHILKTRDNVLLTIVGTLDLEVHPEFAEVDNKIERREFVPHAELPFELMRFDINVAPLEIGNPYCEAKSGNCSPRPGERVAGLFG